LYAAQQAVEAKRSIAHVVKDTGTRISPRRRSTFTAPLVVDGWVFEKITDLTLTLWRGCS
jgi:hypothetical protein